MDEIDERIIGLLRENGRASFASIGEQVGLSPHAAADRVRRLEREGVILGYSAKLNASRLGRPLEAFIDIRLLPNADPDGFERHVRDLPAFREFAFLTGRFDYQVKVSCRDADDLDHTVRSLRQRAGASVTETRIVMRTTSAE